MKNKEEILSLLEAIHLPKKVAITHCPGHQKTRDAVAKGNRMADSAAKQAAQGPMILVVQSSKDYYDVRETSFKYTFEDYQIIKKLGITIGETLYGVKGAKGGKLILS